MQRIVRKVHDDDVPILSWLLPFRFPVGLDMVEWKGFRKSNDAEVGENDRFRNGTLQLVPILYRLLVRSPLGFRRFQPL